MLHHAGAGTGGHDNGPVVREEVELGTGNFPCLVMETAGIGRLASRSGPRENGRVRLPFEKSYGVRDQPGKELVDHAGGKEIDVAGEG